MILVYTCSFSKISPVLLNLKMYYLIIWLLLPVLLEVVLFSHLFILLSLNAFGCCLKFSSMLHGKCVYTSVSERYSYESK